MGAWTTEPTAHEVNGSSEETLVFTGDNSASIQLRCPWDKRHLVAVEVLDGAALFAGGVGGQLASSVSIKPVASGSGTVDGNDQIQYDEALLTINYDVAKVGKLEKDVATGILYSESLEPTIEYITLDHHGFCWGTDANGTFLNEHEAPTRQLRGMNLVRTLYQIPSIDSSILTLPGKTNDTAYTSASLGITFPIETLLFIPPSLQRTVDTAGNKKWNVTLKFGYREKGWNKFWRAAKSGTDKYDEIYSLGAGAVYKNFPTASFSAWLF